MVYSAIFILVLFFDQLSKLLIIDAFRMYEAKEVIPGFFNLVYVTNTGAAFSMLADVESPWRHYFFVSISSVAIIALTIAGMRFRKVNNWYVLAFALIAGGAAGNLVDRIRLGAVVDFLDFYVNNYHWPAFNIADSAICVGAFIFICINFTETNPTSRKFS